MTDTEQRAAALRWALKQITVECNVRSDDLARLEGYRTKGRSTQNRIEATRSILARYLPIQAALREMLDDYGPALDDLNQRA